MMRFNDASDNRQTEAGSFGFGRAQDRRESAFLNFFTHAFTRVPEFKCHMRWVWTRARRFHHA